MKTLLVINEHHILFEEQRQLLGEFEECLIPKEGLNCGEIVDLALDIKEWKGRVVFASPVPLLLKMVSQMKHDTFVFHNDKRNKKELPDGRVINTVSETGWMIL